MFLSQLVKAAKTGALTTAATKTGEHVGNKTEDKIVKMLSKNSESKNVPKKKNKNKVLFMTI